MMHQLIKIAFIFIIICGELVQSLPLSETNLADDPLTLSREKRTIIFRPLFLYREEQEKRLKVEENEEHYNEEQKLLQQNNNDGIGNDY